jgi:diguanylate cyclase (GGDEF)-like protein
MAVQDTPGMSTQALDRPGGPPASPRWGPGRRGPGAMVPSPAERRLRGRSLAVLWAVGTALVAGSLLLRDRTVAEEPRLVAVAGVAAAFCAALWLGSGRLPRWTFDVALAAGTVLLALLVAGGDDPGRSPYVLLFVWQLVFAAYFLPAPRAAAQAVFAAVALTAALLTGPSFPAIRWTIDLATFAVVTGLVAALRAHVDGLVATIEHSARTDPLTGVLNRRGFEEALDAERRRAARTGRPLSVIVCDLDHFKRVNDDHGHAAGDRALQHLAAVLRAEAREVDVIARLGGEEFAVLLPETPPPAAHGAAERMRRALRSAPTVDAIELTASFGVGDATAVDGLARADAAMYAAKAAGRDRTVGADAA